MKKKKATLRKNTFRDNKYFVKWLTFITGALILGGTASFGAILISVSIMEGRRALDPIWIVGMIPLMTMVGLPLTFLVYKQIKKNLSVLIDGMEQVAGGNLETYIPTADAKDFASVYENFNKMVKEIQGIEALRSNMVNELSHELKTPLASINGFAKILAEKQLSEEKQQKYLGIIYGESARLAAMVNNILLLSKLDSQEIVAHKEQYSLTEQLSQCVIGLENQWSGKDIQIQADMPEVMFFGEADLLKSLWLNLLINAVKFTGEGGEVTLALRETDKDVIVSIADTGIGMSAETIKHIFDKHYQADNSQKNSGQGLGLAIVKRIVRLCGGNITAESKEGAGSTFTVTLPK